MPHITVVEWEALTLWWVRGTLVVKRAHPFFKEEKHIPRQDWISWLLLFCGLVSKENWSFPKKAQIILKGHFSLSLKMKTRQSAAGSSRDGRNTQSRKPSSPNEGGCRESERAPVHASSPGTVYKESQQTSTWHTAGMDTHAHTHTQAWTHTQEHILSGTNST